MKKMILLILALSTFVLASCAVTGTLVIENIPSDIHGKECFIILEGYSGSAPIIIKSRIERNYGFFKNDPRGTGDKSFDFEIEIDGFKYITKDARFEKGIAVVNWERFKLIGDLNGSWYRGMESITFSGRDFEYGQDSTSSRIRGTYSFNDSNITFNITQIQHWSPSGYGSWQPFSTSGFYMFGSQFLNGSSVQYNFNANKLTPLSINGKPFFKN